MTTLEFHGYYAFDLTDVVQLVEPDDVSELHFYLLLCKPTKHEYFLPRAPPTSRSKSTLVVRVDCDTAIEFKTWIAYFRNTHVTTSKYSDWVKE